VAELADAADLKSAEGDLLWVQVPPALQIRNAFRGADYFFKFVKFPVGLLEKYDLEKECCGEI
jgi:hypothetical protein